MKKLLFVFLLWAPILVAAQISYLSMPNPLQGQGAEIELISGANLNNVFATASTGSNTNIIRYDGSSWSSSYFSSGVRIMGMEIAEFSGNVVGYAVGRGGSLLKYNGSSWSLLGQYASNNFVVMSGVLVLSSDNVWLCGNEGEIVHYDGTGGVSTWSNESGLFFSDITGKGNTDLWLAGNYDNGTINTARLYHYDGGSTNLDCKFSITDEGFDDILMIDDNRLLITGYKSAYVYNIAADSYTLVYTWPFSAANGRARANKVNAEEFIVTNGPMAHIFRNNVWTSIPDLYGHVVWSPSGDNGHVFIGRNDGEIILWDGVIAGVDENSGPQVAIYPNPVIDRLSIEAPVESVRLYNAVGALLPISPTLTATGATIDLSDLEPGMYLCEAITPQGKITKKVIKR